jgi:hypothetical protein
MWCGLHLLQVHKNLKISQFQVMVVQNFHLGWDLQIAIQEQN